MKALIFVISLAPLMWAQESVDTSKLDVGVYAKADGKIEALKPETVAWKAGSSLKHIASAGMIRRDVNAHVDGAHSATPAGPKAQLVVIAPEGAEITRYQLVRMRANTDSREFHASGSGIREAVDFSVRRNSAQSYVLSLDLLADGEYGLLPPGAEPGKIYSFRVVNSGVQIARRSNHDDLLHNLAWPGHDGDMGRTRSDILHDLAWPGH